MGNSILGKIKLNLIKKDLEEFWAIARLITGPGKISKFEMELLSDSIAKVNTILDKVPVNVKDDVILLLNICESVITQFVSEGKIPEGETHADINQISRKIHFGIYKL